MKNSFANSYLLASHFSFSALSCSLLHEDIGVSCETIPAYSSSSLSVISIRRPYFSSVASIIDILFLFRYRILQSSCLACRQRSLIEIIQFASKILCTRTPYCFPKSIDLTLLLMLIFSIILLLFRRFEIQYFSRFIHFLCKRK